MEKGEEFLQDKVRVDVHSTSGITLSNQQTIVRERDREKVERRIESVCRKEKKREKNATATKRLGVRAIVADCLLSLFLPRFFIFLCLIYL